MIFFIHGPDALLVRRNLKEILLRLDPDGANTTRVDGRTTAPQTIAGMVATPAFLGMARVIVVDDLFARSKSSQGEDDDEPETPASKPNTVAIELLNQVAEPNSLILVEPSLASVPAIVKRSAAGIEVRAGNAPRGRELLNWVDEQARSIGSDIDGRAAQALLEAMSPGMWRQASRNPAYDVPPDLDAIQQEILKLATFAHPDPIQMHHVRTMTSVGVADQLFPLLDALFSGNMPESIQLLSDALDRGEDHFRLLAQVFTQAELSPLLETGRRQDPEAIGKEIGMANPKRMAMIARAALRFPVTPRFDAVVAADRDQKQGRLRTPEDTLFALITALGNR